VAGGQERVLRRRIRSVQSTKKITKAMELIAASQIVRAQNRIAANRPYRLGIARIVAEAQRADPTAAAKLARSSDASGGVGVVAIVGDRGLAGAYNSSVFRSTERLVAELSGNGAPVKVFTVGKKAPAYFRFRGIEVERSFLGFSDRPSFSDAQGVAGAAWWAFLNGEIDKLILVSTRFISSGSQSVKVAQLLPLPEAAVPGDGEAPAAPDRLLGYTEFEPDPERLLEELAPRYIESELFSALLEGAASFFTAQQRAMAAATDNADELIRTLSRIMNRARQDAITTEIMEIVGGAEALRQSKGA
jgi:F-type H+-transporting ATPase subunit gamma